MKRSIIISLLLMLESLSFGMSILPLSEFSKFEWNDSLMDYVPVDLYKSESDTFLIFESIKDIKRFKNDFNIYSDFNGKIKSCPRSIFIINQDTLTYLRILSSDKEFYLQKRLTYYKGKKNGLLFSSSPFGATLEEYYNGRKNGQTIKFYPNSLIISTENFNNDTLKYIVVEDLLNCAILMVFYNNLDISYANYSSNNCTINFEFDNGLLKKKIKRFKNGSFELVLGAFYPTSNVIQLVEVMPYHGQIISININGDTTKVIGVFD